MGTFFLRGECLALSLFLFPTAAFADTLTLKNGKELKGLVVEQHADRIILSTENGEKPILRSGIKKIDFDDPAQNFFQAGKSYEEQNKLGEALAYYEKAASLNPGFEDAKKAAMAVRNRFWAQSQEGPRGEIEKQQTLYDSWGSGRTPEELIKGRAASQAQRLREGLGVTLEQKGDWVRVTNVDSKKDAALAGLRKGDRLISIDGTSLRYLGVDVVTKKMLEPRLSSFTLDLERDCFLKGPAAARDARDFGVKLKLEYEGVFVDAVVPKSAGDLAGLHEGDLLAQVNGSSTRYLPLSKITEQIRKSAGSAVVFTVRRQAMMMRR